MRSNEKSDAEKWNAKYTSRSGDLRDPDRFLSDNLSSLIQGTVLDVACGDGRNSILLASEGFAVTAADISEVGLNRLQLFARNRRVQVATKEIDLENPNENFIGLLGPFQNIVMINYKPIEALWEVLPALLTEGGILLYCTFNTKHHENHGFPERFCVKTGLHKTPPPSLRLLKYEEIQEPAHNRDGYIFEKQ